MDLSELAEETQKKAKEAWDEIKSAIDENTAWNQARDGSLDAYDPTNIGQSIREAGHKQVDFTPVSGIGQKIKAKINSKFNPVSKSSLKKEAKNQAKGMTTEYAKKKEEEAEKVKAAKIDALRKDSVVTMPGSPEAKPSAEAPELLPSSPSADAPDVASRWAHRTMP
jgi:hypothetical protein